MCVCQLQSVTGAGASVGMLSTAQYYNSCLAATDTYIIDRNKRVAVSTPTTRTTYIQLKIWIVELIRKVFKRMLFENPPIFQHFLSLALNLTKINQPILYKFFIKFSKLELSSLGNT